MRIGDLIRKLTPRKVREVMAYSDFDEYSRKVYSQEGEDLLLSRIFDQQPEGFYVDCGAHHPFRFSNTKLLYDRGWNGINIEPNPESISLFRKTRDRDQTVNCGVGSESKSLSYFMFSHPALNTFDENIYEKLKEHHVKTLITLVKPLRTILEEYLPKGQKIDLLSIDVEGFDLEVLKSNDWNRYIPAFILIENTSDTVDGVFDSDIHSYLSSHDYQLVSKLWKTCLYRKN